MRGARRILDRIVPGHVPLGMTTFSRNGALAFIATLSLLIPAGWDYLGAGGPEEGPSDRPPIQTADYQGVKIALTTDHALYEDGGTVRVLVAATSSDARKVPLEVAIMEQTGSEMSRVMTPPREIGKKSILMVSGPAGARQELAFRLDAAGAGRRSGRGHALPRDAVNAALDSAP